MPTPNSFYIDCFLWLHLCRTDRINSLFYLLVAYLNTILIFNTINLLVNRNLLSYLLVLAVEVGIIYCYCSFSIPDYFNFGNLDCTSLHLIFQHFFIHLIIVHSEI